MQDLTTRLAQLRRPSLLMNAARHGLERYSRDVHLPRLLSSEVLGGQANLLTALLDLEAAHDADRRSGHAGYRIEMHVATLVALIAEARVYRAPRLAAA